mgnify:CR=1 FL=1
MALKRYFFYENRENEIFVAKVLAFNAHLHEKVELVYMLNGSSTAVVNGREFIIGESDFLVVLPNCVHCYYNDSPGSRPIVAIISADSVPALRAELTQKSAVNPAGHDENGEIGRLLEAAAHCGGKYAEEKKRGLLLAALAMMLEKIELTNEKNSFGGSVADILEYCEKNFRNDITAEQMARELHLGKTYISRLFGKKLRMSFRSYINSLRLAEAVKLLEESDSSMTEIASESGFETIRTFNRCFKNQVGMTPFEYRKLSRMK